MNSESENSTILTDRQLLELVLKEITVVKNEQRLIKNEQQSIKNEQQSIKSAINAHYESFNQRLLELEVQTETLISLAHQALSVAHAVKADVRALREESASHGRDISELQTKILEAA